MSLVTTLQTILLPADSAEAVVSKVVGAEITVTNTGGIATVGTNIPVALGDVVRVVAGRIVSKRTSKTTRTYYV